MRALSWLLSCGLLACSPPAAQPSIAPVEAPVQRAPAASVSVGAAPVASVSAAQPAASASAGAPAPRAPLAAVVPRASVVPVTDTYDDREHEGWPELSYQGFPAVSADGTRVVIVEERDGSGHVPKFGVRVLDAGTGKTAEWFELAPGAKAPSTRAGLLASVLVLTKRVAAMNEKLAKTAWLSLARTDTTPDADFVWHAAPLAIGVSWTADDVPQPKRLVVRDEATKAVLVERDLAAWSRKGIKCARNDLQLVGTSPTLLVFKQAVGPTLHDCDGVPVPTAYRFVPLTAQ